MTPLTAIGAVNGVACGLVVVRLGLDHVAERGQPEGVGIRGDPLVVLREQAEIAVEAAAGSVTVVRGLAGRVADPADIHRLAQLAAGGHDGRRPREVADVQPVEAGAVARVGALADLDDVRAVLGATTEANPSCQTSAASSLAASSNRLAFEDRHVGVELEDAPAGCPSTSAVIRSPFLASTTK